MVHYDKDYLLSQALGRAAKQHLNGAVLLTDCQDNEHVFQYYSEAQCFLHTDNVATIEKALAVYAKSGRREPMYFISTTADQVKRIIPDLQAFPDGKFTGEFDLEENKNTPLWQYLVNHFQSQDVNGFTAFRLTP